LVSDVRASCGCSRPSFSKQKSDLACKDVLQMHPQRLQPGEKAYVRFDLDLNRLAPGKIEKSVWIMVQGDVAATLEMTGTLNPAILFLPSAIQLNTQHPDTSRQFDIGIMMDTRLVLGGVPPPLRSDDPRITIQPVSRVSDRLLSPASSQAPETLQKRPTL